MFRRFVFLVPLAVALVVSGAMAAPLDGSANSKIDEAINEHYLATDFDKAEGVLLGVLKACGEKCSAATLARAWMYIGLVRGSGRQNQDGAMEAFQKAVTEDPGVKLDQALATPETQATFDAAKGTEDGAAQPEPTADASDVATGGDIVSMDCTPAVREVQTNRQIPVSCELPAGGSTIELAYRFGADASYTSVLFSRDGQLLSAAVPCGATASVGELHVYAVASAESGALVGQWGTPDAPVVFSVVATTTMSPPSLPGKPAPPPCGGGGMGDAADCPPGFPGCAGSGAWGDSCTPAEPCKEGLYCSQGICEPSPTCDVDEDCDSGVCSSGYCQMDTDTGGSGGAYKKNWFGAHFAIDIPFVAGNSLCRLDGGWNDGFRCYNNGIGPIERNVWNPDAPNDGIQLWSSGQSPAPVMGTMRALLSYDRFFSPRFSLGVRAGFAFGGGDAQFMPVHAEARLAYYLIPINDLGFNPYIFAGGGLAQVNGRVDAKVCPYNTDPDPELRGCPRDPNQVLTIDAYKLMGLGFVQGGAGALIGVAGDSGVLLNVGVMYMFPFAGVNIEPSLGYVFGF